MRLKVIDTCEVLVCSILSFGMDHINKFKLKDIMVLLCYHFGSEKMKRIPKKVELVDAVKYFLGRIGRVLCRDGGGGCPL